MNEKINVSDFLDSITDVDGNPHEDASALLSGDDCGGEMYRNGVQVEVVEHEGGEGEGEHAHVVLKIGEEYWRADYSYYSYCGYDYDYSEFRIVKPAQKTITVYE